MSAPVQRIAVIDDDASICKALSRLLRTRGFEVDAYESPGAFLASLGTQRPDCMIVDMQMPHITGIELLRQLARTGQTIPAIVITGHALPATREDCRSMGVACLEKPLQEQTILSAIRDATGSTA